MKEGIEGDVYLDANVLIYATLDNESIGKRARQIIERVKNGDFFAFTSTLTFDEFLWSAQKVLGKEKAADIARKFLVLVNLELVNVDRILISNAINIYARDNLHPRDAIHLAAMQIRKIKTLISSDPDFDKIKGIRRIDYTS